MSTNELQELIAIRRALEGGTTSPSSSGNNYTNPNYSGIIAAVNTPQDLCSANPNRDRITIQNLSQTGTILIGINEDASIGRSYEIEPRGTGIIESGEADKRISIMSSETGLKFVAIARIKS